MGRVQDHSLAPPQLSANLRPLVNSRTMRREIKFFDSINTYIYIGSTE